MDSTAKQPIKLAVNNVEDFLSRYDTFLVDCDGVMWKLGTYHPIPGIAKAVGKLKSKGKRLIFASNNNVGKNSDFLEKFPKVAGIEIKETDLYRPPYIAALYLKNVAKMSGKCYVVGGEVIASLLERHGFECLGLGPDPDPVSADPAVLLKQKLDPDVKAVVVGYDEHLSYNKIFKAASYISNPQCQYIAMNDRENWIQLAPGYRQPVTGCMVAAVTAAAGRDPIFVGKPYRQMFDCILAENPDIKPARTVMIGDSIWSDMPFAKNSGIASVLALSGETTAEDLREKQHSNKPSDKIHMPDYYIESLAEFSQLIM